MISQKNLKKCLTYCKQYAIIISEQRKGGDKLGDIEKALKELAEAVKNSETVTKVTVTITLTKPKPDKAKS